LRLAGWERRAVIVNDPELDNWAWSRSPHLPGLLGWNLEHDMREWLVERGFLDRAEQAKPRRPKEALEAVLAFVKKPRSSALYRAIAEKVSLTHCEDPAFAKLRATLREWFPTRD